MSALRSASCRLAAAVIMLAGTATWLLQPPVADAQDTDGAAILEQVRAARARVAAVATRATVVEDINAIENLQRAYGYYFDKMLWDHVTDLFADNGTLERVDSGVYAGKASIRAYLASLGDGAEVLPEGLLYDHWQLQPVITVNPDGQTASGRWRSLIMTGVAGSGSGGNWGEGVYENTYIKEDGTWKILSLTWYGNFLSPYEGGWLNADPAMLREHVASDVAPDAPPTIEYDPYPGAFAPPFHYPNPGRATQED